MIRVARIVWIKRTHDSPQTAWASRALLFWRFLLVHNYTGCFVLVSFYKNSQRVKLSKARAEIRCRDTAGGGVSVRGRSDRGTAVSVARSVKTQCASGQVAQFLYFGNVQLENTDNMMFPVVEMLVYITEGITLEPGDVIFTGTPSGVGHARKPPVWMKNGDIVEVEIQGIGILRNPIADEK